MKNTKAKETFIKITGWLYALLFLYASVAKIIDYQDFRIQLGQSPLFAAIAIPVSIAVPVAEIIVAFLLFSEKFRMPALFAGYGLMCMFSAYIYIILNYSPYVPCSCGGVLEKMDWNQHLLFNLVFVILAAIAIVFSTDPKIIRNYENRK